MGGKARIGVPENFEVTIYTRPLANQLREQISSAQEDGVLTDIEKAVIAASFIAVSDSVNRNDPDGPLGAETSPLFGVDRTVTSLGTGGILGGYNRHSAALRDYPAVVRPGFELNALDVLAEYTPLAILTTADIEKIGISPVYPSGARPINPPCRAWVVPVMLPGQRNTMGGVRRGV